eukprot:2984210-Prymnesium_polylepis.1
MKAKKGSDRMRIAIRLRVQLVRVRVSMRAAVAHALADRRSRGVALAETSRKTVILCVCDSSTVPKNREGSLRE